MESEIESFPKINLTVLQDKSAFCFGIDAILLSDFARVKKGSKGYDLGTGTGIIPLLMARTSSAAHFTALEIQKEFVEIAGQNVENNCLSDRISIFQGDIKSISSLFKAESADFVTSNPPYAKADSVRENPNEAKNIARHEVLCNLEDVVKGAAWLLKSNGSFYMIHRPQRLSEIIQLFSKYRLEVKNLQLVQPFQESQPSMILVEGRKNARPGLEILPSLTVYREKGLYSQRVQEIYDKLC
ncbi:MAG: tRNA1(Val) (adenine(37)-N6)-methyltransferase [Treponema sp.]|nr:tRNA1(Val) (adenine(37)-N6)-methyltransferase [Treponema sp.]